MLELDWVAWVKLWDCKTIAHFIDTLNIPSRRATKREFSKATSLYCSLNTTYDLELELSNRSPKIKDYNWWFYMFWELLGIIWEIGKLREGSFQSKAGSKVPSCLLIISTWFSRSCQLLLMWTLHSNIYLQFSVSKSWSNHYEGLSQQM